VSNRNDLSKMRSSLQDLVSDLQGVQRRIIAIKPAGDVYRARDRIQEAIAFLDEALLGNVDIAPTEAFTAARQ
jgi:hypothetical protein